MKIFNNQKLHYDHLLSYTCSVKKEKWLELVDYMCRNMPVLNNTLNGFPIIVKQGENDDLSEILIPILENKNEIQTEFEYKHDFKIENALSNYSLDKSEIKITKNGNLFTVEILEDKEMLLLMMNEKCQLNLQLLI